MLSQEYNLVKLYYSQEHSHTFTQTNTILVPYTHLGALESAAELEGPVQLAKKMGGRGNSGRKRSGGV